MCSSDLSNFPNLSSFHTNHVDFETQIQEIDSTIRKFDNCGEHVDHITAGTSHVLENIEKQLVPSLPAHSLVIQEQAHHVTENSSSPNPVNRTLHTSKKLA